MELSDTLARGAKASIPLLGEVVQVLAFFAGIGLVCYGVWLIYEPAAYILAGLVMAGLVALYVRGS